MSVLNVLRSRSTATSFGGVRPQEYAPNRLPPGLGISEGFELEPTWDSNRAVLEGLKQSAILATCISRVCAKAASVPWHWWRTAKSGREEKLGEVEFIEYPRRDGKISRVQMMDEAHHHAWINGNALFGLGWSGGSKYRLKPIEMQVENPYGCAPVPDRVKHISAYKWEDATLASRNFWFSEDIVHVIGRTDPANKYWGWSILEALAYTIDADVELRRSNLVRLRKGGAPSVILKDTEIDNAKERARVENDLNSNAKKYLGGFMVLTGTQDITSNKPLTEVELGIIASMNANRNEIVVACDLHPAMFGPDAATFSNFEIARTMEWQVAVLKNARFADAFSCKFVDRSQRGSMFIAPDYSEVDELSTLDRQIARTKDLIASCRVSLNEASSITGLPVAATEHSATIFVPGGLIPIEQAVESADAPVDEE